MEVQNGNKTFVVTGDGAGSKAPRHYYGADVQLQKKHGWGRTELRGEYWTGKQPGTAATTVNPGTLPLGPTYIRNFDGAFFYFLQNIINTKWDLAVKYDWYDPNTDVAGKELGQQGTNLTGADVKFSTLGFGVTRYLNANLKVVLYYDWVQNETTGLSSYTNDIKDNVLTCRLQFAF